MSAPELVLIAAVARNGVIGRDNALPWRLKADLAHFKRTTLGCPVVMGRKTWASLGRPLPGRANVVVSRNSAFHAEGAQVAGSLDAAIARCGDVATIFVIGGAQLYAEAISRAQRLVITEVHAQVDGDARFPPIDPALFEEVSRSHRPADADNDHPLDFVDYRRR